MWPTVLLGLVAGFMAANGLPYFVLGSFGREHRFLLGRSATANVVAGWTAIVIAGVCWHFTDTHAHPVPAWTAAAIGALSVGLIHARVWETGSFRRPAPSGPL